MSDKTKRAVTIGLLVIVALAAAAGVTYYLQQRRIDQLESQLRTRQAELKALAARADRLDAALRSQSESTSATASTADAAVDSAAGSGESEPPKPKPEPTTSRQFAFVRKATDKNGKISLVLDFAQFMTGDAAAKAAAAAGDESPPPNDYYISNTNPKLRTFPVDKRAKFVIASSDPNDTTTLSAGQFQDAIANNTDGAADAAYWFVITNGTISSGEQQWLP